mmetsp:Transcript_4516/g.13701  ORF Transcript_4516/g.13701 Transcript_4516/m.13701 type:complete len:219 (+) Transcript_4516:179-835(+)|eukprot:CAMPEP_0198724444 /NCGR_PEP_ID=MMETSP1475-20131203/1915_1 /TAXON_ID= ORGANISM="Unidentified sp., Strain CCMP1999" /NCGR_SAMPLE_ID=MMETSP1475 /ASSEMBLY_ACC=CAM_ASM_001111 /LENGTH=218 /DNA_ID=CAMNT_0044485977 /DNA_START=141 /DNA_END=797 /DNA_ORIENTATION=+
MSTSSLSNTTVQEWSSSDHVTIWNRNEKRKIAGNAAPLGRNLQKYLDKHPDCEVYRGQDEADGKPRKRRRSVSSAKVNPGEVTCNIHVPIWHLREQRKIAGNAAPLAKNLASYLASHPETEVYDGQDVRKTKVVKLDPVMSEDSEETESFRSEDRLVASIPFDPWLAGSVVPEECLTDEENWNTLEDRISNWSWFPLSNPFKDDEDLDSYSSLDLELN